MPARGDDDHEVGGGAPRTVGALGLPVREVRRLDHHRHAGTRHVERDGVVRGPTCSTPSRSASGFFATWRASSMSARCQLDGPSSVSGRSSASGSSNHGTARHSHALNSATPGVPGGGSGFAFALPVGVGVEVVRDDGFVRQRGHDGRVGDFVDLPAERRTDGEVGDGRDLSQRGIAPPPAPACRASPRSSARPSAGGTARRARSRPTCGTGGRRRDSTESIVSVAAARKWYGGRAGGLVVETLHRADAPVGPVREHHERERSAVLPDRRARLPEHPAREAASAPPR